MSKRSRFVGTKEAYGGKPSSLNDSPASIPAYHIDAARQLPQSADRGGTAQHTPACQVIDAIGAEGRG